MSAERTNAAALTVLATKRLLVVFPGYAAPHNEEPFVDAAMLGNAFARMLTRLRDRATRDHVRSYRDFYANPRSATYMAERLRDLFEHGKRDGTALVLDPALDIDASETEWASEIRRGSDKLARMPRELLDLVPAYEAVLLVHSDALGLGLGRLERMLIAASPGGVFVLNGRRRLYRIDPRMQRRLSVRRIFAETRIVEMILARVVAIMGWLLAGYDRLLSRRPS